MPSDRLVDTSIAIPLVLEFHPDHRTVTEWVGTRRLGLCGHAAFEAFATLSRMPPPYRRTPVELRLMFATTFPATVHLSASRASVLFDELAELAISGGAVYDALVGAAAVENAAILMSRDRRARPTYAALGADVEFAPF